MKRPVINKKPKVGDMVFVVECGNAARYNRSQGLPPNTYTMEVERVGRQYFYLKKGRRVLKVRIKGWKEFTEYSTNYNFYENEEAYRQVERWNTLSSKIKEFIDNRYGSSPPVTLTQLEDIAEILYIG